MLLKKIFGALFIGFWGCTSAVCAQTGNVGIGTMSPGSTLTVNGSFATAYTNVTANSYTLGDTVCYVGWNGTASGSIYLPAGSATLAGRNYFVKNASPTYTLTIYPAASTENIDGNANIVLAPGEVVQMIMKGTAAGTIASPAATTEVASIGNGTTTAGTPIARPWTTGGNKGTSPATNFIGTSDAADLVLRTANAERVRVSSSGNVGIGVNIPSTTLDVAGNVKISNMAATGGTNMVTVDNNGILCKQALPSASAPTIQGVLSTGINLTPANWIGWNYTGDYVTIPANSKYVIFGTFYIATGLAPTSTQALTLRVSVSNSSSAFSLSPDIAGSYYITGTLPPIAGSTTMSGTIVINNTSNVAKNYYLWAGSASVYGTYNGTIQNFGASTTTYFEDGIFAVPIN